MPSHLVWMPASGLEHIGELPDSLEVVAIPDDAVHDPRIGEVEFLVPPVRSDFRPEIDFMTSLRVVQTISAGVDAIVDAVPPGVTLCSARGAHDGPVAEWVVMAILAGLRELAFFRDEQVAGRWSRRPGTLLADSTVLFLGYGSIAEAVEARIAPFGPAVLRVARRERDGVAPLEQLDELLPRSDVLVILLPLTAATRELVSADVLAKLPDRALVVNAARGLVVDQDALLAELTSGRLRAVLDTVEPEPLPEGHPLYSAPNTLLTPHTGGQSARGLAGSFRIITDQLRRFAAGEPLINVAEAGY